MSEPTNDPTDQTTEPDASDGDGGGEPQTGQEPKTARSLTELLADMPDDVRSVVLSEVGKSRTEAKKYRQQLRDAQTKAAQYDQLVEAQKTAEQRAQEAAEKAEQRAKTALTRAVTAEVKALAAAGNFADPEDAAAFLGDLSDYVDDDGDIATEQIRADLTALLERKPHLRKPDSNTRRTPAPDPSQGSSGNGSRVGSAPRDQFANVIGQSLNQR